MQNALIVEDIPETSVWLQQVLMEAFPATAMTACADCASTLAFLQNKPSLNLVLLDISLPDGSGVDLIQPILKVSPDAYVVMSTIFDDENHIVAALKCGAKGYLLKDSPDKVFVQKLRGILTGDPPLSPGVARKILQHFTASQSASAAESSTEASISAQAMSLSIREKEVLVLVTKGLSRKEVAQQLDLSINTVARYIRDVYQKLNISSRAEAAVEAYRMGLMDDDDKSV